MQADIDNQGSKYINNVITSRGPLSHTLIIWAPSPHQRLTFRFRNFSVSKLLPNL